MTRDELLARVGEAGDGLWAEHAPRDFAEDGPRPAWSLCHVWLGHLDSGRAGALAHAAVLGLLPLLIILDLAHGLGRLLAYPLLRGLWWLARRRRAPVFCPACHHVMRERWPFCPAPGCRAPLQPALRPHPNALRSRGCPCGRTHWPVAPGSAAPLVCRPEGGASGCLAPVRIAALTGPRRRHVAVAGAEVVGKHRVLGELLRALVRRGVAGAHYQPAWEGADWELRWYERYLAEGGPVNETPGRRYPLAWALILEAGERRPVLCLHNHPLEWLGDADELARRGCNWGAMDELLFVVSPWCWAPGAAWPPAEAFARLLRDTEETCLLPPGARAPYAVTVVVTEVEDGESALRENAPGLLALLRRVVRPGRLRVFGTGKEGWEEEVCRAWVGR